MRRKRWAYGAGRRQRFMHELCLRLGVRPERAIPGYEDAYYYLWKERTLPVNVDPREHDLDDDEERRRLARLLEQGLGKVVGYALPLRWQETVNGGHWLSGSLGAAARSSVSHSGRFAAWATACRWRPCPGWRNNPGDSL